MQQPKTMDTQDWGLLILLSFLWGGAYFFAGVAVREMPPLTVVFFRVALAALTLLPLFWLLGHSVPKSLRSWGPFIGMGLLNNVLPFALIFAGQTHITVGLAAIMNAMTPLFTVMVMFGFRQEALSRNRVFGIICGIFGVAVIQGIGEEPSSSQTLGIVLCLGAALSYGFAALWGRRFLADVPPIKSATLQLVCSSAMMLVVVAVLDKPWMLPAPSVPALGAVVALAVVGTALAYLVFFKILVRAGASNVMLVTLLIPVTALVLGNFFLNEPIQSKEIIGGAMIGVGLLFIDGRVITWVVGKRHSR